MSLIKYTLPSGECRVWNSSWFLLVSHTRAKDHDVVQITTAIAPGGAPKAAAGGLAATRDLITINLQDDEARMFLAGYNRITA